MDFFMGSLPVSRSHGPERGSWSNSAPWGKAATSPTRDGKNVEGFCQRMFSRSKVTVSFHLFHPANMNPPPPHPDPLPPSGPDTGTRIKRGPSGSPPPPPLRSPRSRSNTRTSPPDITDPRQTIAVGNAAGGIPVHVDVSRLIKHRVMQRSHRPLSDVFLPGRLRLPAVGHSVQGILGNEALVPAAIRAIRIHAEGR